MLLSQSLQNSVLTGGSGARNITKVYRLTYDVDYDTCENNFDVICGWLRNANKSIGGTGSLDAYGTPGAITMAPYRNVRATFEGDRKLAPFVRWMGETQYIKIHIMCVPDMPEMFREFETLDLDRGPGPGNGPDG